MRYGVIVLRYPRFPYRIPDAVYWYPWTVEIDLSPGTTGRWTVQPVHPLNCPIFEPEFFNSFLYIYIYVKEK